MCGRRDSNNNDWLLALVHYLYDFVIVSMFVCVYDVFGIQFKQIGWRNDVHLHCLVLLTSRQAFSNARCIAHSVRYIILLINTTE